MAPTAFRPHGTALVELSGAILTVHMHGDWNAEMRSQTSLQMRKYAPALNAAGPWAICNILHDTLVYSEALYVSARQDYASRPAESRLQAVAFVIAPHVEGASLLGPRYQTLLDGVIDARVFQDPQSAHLWLQEQLDRVRQS